VLARVPSILLQGLDNYVTRTATDNILHRGGEFCVMFEWCYGHL
jgi:hypothetical protein